MDNVISMLFHVEKKSKIVLFRYDTMLKQLNRDNLYKFLLTRSLKNLSNELFYNSILKSFFCDAYDFIIKNIDEINCIQIYKDNAIRLWTGDSKFTSSIIFEDYDFCNNKLTSTMIKELISLARKTEQFKLLRGMKKHGLLKRKLAI